MKVLNLYFSRTGNTAKIAKEIEKAVREAEHDVETVKVSADTEIDILRHDLVFVGSGVYTWLPGKPMLEFLDKSRQRYAQSGELRPASPRRPGRKVVVYCSFGGVHTGINEAIPAVKYMGQLFDHLGYEIVSEWYILGEYHEGLALHSTAGRMGDITGRPNQADLEDVYQRVRGVLRV